MGHVSGCSTSLPSQNRFDFQSTIASFAFISFACWLRSQRSEEVSSHHPKASFGLVQMVNLRTERSLPSPGARDERRARVRAGRPAWPAFHNGPDHEVLPEPALASQWVTQACFGSSFRSRRVASSRSISLVATARVSSSHSGPSTFGSIPLRRRKTMHAPSAARLLPSMNG